MASLSLSPSGSSSNRRLSELLEEQQEPFSLDLYLLDRGCSPAILDAAGAASSACWPRSRSAARTLRRSGPVSRKTRSSGLLRLLLSKLLHGTAEAPKKIKKQQSVAIDWGGAVDGAGDKLTSNLKNAAPSSPSPGRLDGTVQDDMEEEEEEEDDDDDDPKQLSPVSVLEQHPFQQASTPAHTQKAMAIFRELLAAAYTPALPDHLAKQSSNVSTTTANAPAPATTRTGRTKNSAAAVRWEEKLEAQLTKVHDLIASEMTSGGRVRSAGDVRRDVGADVAAAVLEELMEEVAVELIGMDHDHDAIDVARCGWC